MVILSSYIPISLILPPGCQVSSNERAEAIGQANCRLNYGVDGSVALTSGLRVVHQLGQQRHEGLEVETLKRKLLVRSLLSYSCLNYPYTMFIIKPSYSFPRRLMILFVKVENCSRKALEHLGVLCYPYCRFMKQPT